MVKRFIGRRAHSAHGLEFSVEHCSRQPAAAGLARKPFTYFAHSYYAPLVAATAATCTYIHPYTAILEQDNVYAVQFHPEKSGPVGLRVMQNFLERLMLAKRIIPCLDVTGGRVVKGVNFVDLRDAGDPVELAERYNAQGADELVFLDITASSDAREIMADLVARTARRVFIPLDGRRRHSRTVADARKIILAGADKVSVNTAAVHRPELIRELSQEFGAQAVVLAIDARRSGAGQVECISRKAAATMKASMPSNGRSAAKRSARVKFC